MSQGLAADGAGDWLTSPLILQVSSSTHYVTVSSALNIHTSSPLTSLLLQSQQHELKAFGSRSEVTEEQLSTDKQLRNAAER